MPSDESLMQGRKAKAHAWGERQQETVVVDQYVLCLTEEQVARIIKLSHTFEGGERFPRSDDKDHLRLAHELQHIFPELYNKTLNYTNLPWEQWKEKFNNE